MVLLVFSAVQVLSMGIELLPTSTSNEAVVTLSTTDTLSKEESYTVAGKVVEAVMAVDGVEEVGITTDTSVAGMDISQLGLPSQITSLLAAANSYGNYKINVMLSESLSSSQLNKACTAIEEAVAGIEDCTATVKQYGMTDDLTSQLSSGLSVKNLWCRLRDPDRPFREGGGTGQRDRGLPERHQRPGRRRRHHHPEDRPR